MLYRKNLHSFQNVLSRCGITLNIPYQFYTAWSLDCLGVFFRLNTKKEKKNATKMNYE